MGKFLISKGSETLEITLEGLGEMFEGESDSASVDGGPSGESCMRRPGSEDPHQR